MLEESMNNWQLIYSKPKQEYKAKENLENQGVGVCFPEIMVEKIQKGKLKNIIEPLFPRYLFVKIPQNVAWTTVRSSRGVSDFVRFGNEVATITDDMLNQINQLLDHNTAEQLTNIPHEGDAVIIKTGEFAGLEGVFKQRDGEQRCYVLLDILGRTNKVRMDLAKVSKAS